MQLKFTIHTYAHTNPCKIWPSLTHALKSFCKCECECECDCTLWQIKTYTYYFGIFVVALQHAYGEEEYMWCKSSRKNTNYWK